jgi:hypothetical protein
MRIPHLFYSSDPERQTLHRRITPTADQREEQQGRWNDLRHYLIGDLAEKTGLTMASWLQGSYKFGTQVRPVSGGEFDVDLGMYFSWAGSADDGSYSPEQIKRLVHISLVRYAAEAGEEVLEVLDPPKERCARIRFTGKFHIDVPAYHLDPDADERSLATETKGWEDSDPKALYLWFREKFEDDEHTLVRRLIRYLKIWSALNLDDCFPSVVLTVLVCDAFDRLSEHEVASDDVAIKNVAGAIAARLRSSSEVPNPVNRMENLNRFDDDKTLQLASELEALVATAELALAAATEADAAVHWTSAFHHFFPAPDQATNVITETALVPVSFDPQVRVEATAPNGARTFVNTNRIGPIPKKCSITFTLNNSNNLPAGARVRWIVRNEGSEAELTNDLGHRAGEGYQATENSAYRGTHYMDVVVTSAAGSVLGFKRIPVEISGLPMPARNPKRPGWTRFRSRK